MSTCGKTASRFLGSALFAFLFPFVANAACTPNSGYPWPAGGCLNAADLNTAFANRATTAALATVTADIVTINSDITTINSTLALKANLTGADFTGRVMISPSGTTQGLVVSQIPTGTVSAPIYYNYIQTDDEVDSGSAFRQALGVIHNYGGHEGGIQSLAVYSRLRAPTGVGNSNRNYVAGFFSASADSSDSGVPGTPRGAFFGVGVSGYACGSAIIPGSCDSGVPATDLLEVTGGEVNVGVATGASVSYKGGWTIAAYPTDAVQGTDFDCELCLSNQPGAVGWRDMILIGDMNGAFPVAIAGTVLRTINGTVENGIDLHTTIFNGSSIWVPGLVVNGSGVIINTGVPTSCSGQVTGTLVNISGDARFC